MAQHALDPGMPSLSEVVEAVHKRLFADLAGAESARTRTISQRLVSRFAVALMELDTGNGSPQVQGIARAGLRNLARETGRVRGMRAFDDW